MPTSSKSHRNAKLASRGKQLGVSVRFRGSGQKFFILFSSRMFLRASLVSRRLITGGKLQHSVSWTGNLSSAIFRWPKPCLLRFCSSLSEGTDVRSSSPPALFVKEGSPLHGEKRTDHDHVPLVQGMQFVDDFAKKYQIPFALAREMILNARGDWIPFFSKFIDLRAITPTNEHFQSQRTDFNAVLDYQSDVVVERRDVLFRVLSYNLLEEESDQLTLLGGLVARRRCGTRSGGQHTKHTSSLSIAMTRTCLHRTRTSPSHRAPPKRRRL